MNPKVRDGICIVIVYLIIFLGWVYREFLDLRESYIISIALIDTVIIVYYWIKTYSSGEEPKQSYTNGNS